MALKESTIKELKSLLTVFEAYDAEEENGDGTSDEDWIDLACAMADAIERVIAENEGA